MCTRCGCLTAGFSKINPSVGDILYIAGSSVTSALVMHVVSTEAVILIEIRSLTNVKSHNLKISVHVHVTNTRVLIVYVGALPGLLSFAL